MTPGCICHERLRQKAGETGKTDPRETSLRLTPDPGRAHPPGRLVIVEIWPGGHYSPFRDHGNACAVIEVLYGDIWAKLYPASDPRLIDYFEEALFHSGDVMWLTPDHYRVHRLVNHNPSGRMAAMLQCYRRLDGNIAQGEWLDAIDGDKRRPFAPGSDWPYLAFREMIRAEWAAAPQG